MGSLFSKPKTPAIPKPVPMPVQEDVDKAKKRSIIEQQQRSGRASTLLTSDDEGL